MFMQMKSRPRGGGKPPTKRETTVLLSILAVSTGALAWLGYDAVKHPYTYDYKDGADSVVVTPREETVLHWTGRDKGLRADFKAKQLCDVSTEFVVHGPVAHNDLKYDHCQSFTEAAKTPEKKKEIGKMEGFLRDAEKKAGQGQARLGKAARAALAA
jgi:hypothetical protein